MKEWCTSRRCRNIAVCGFVIIALFSVSSISYAGLKDFSDETKKSEKKSSSSGSSSSNSDSDDDDAADEIFGAILFEMLLPFWFYANSGVVYAPYPYSNIADGNNYFFHEKELTDLEKMSEIEKGNAKPGGFNKKKYLGIPDDSRKWNISLSAAHHYAGDDVLCESVSLKTRFKRVAGFDVESRYYHDKDGHLNCTTAVLNFPIVQYDYFSPDVYAGWGGFQGMLKRNGLAAGCLLTVYPYRPFILHGKAGMLAFDKIAYRDFEGSLGVILNRYEVYGGYRILYSKKIDSRLKGWECGVRLWL